MAEACAKVLIYYSQCEYKMGKSYTLFEYKGESHAVRPAF